MAEREPRTKRRVAVPVGSRPALSLLDLERYEPVLMSSPRLHALPDAPSTLTSTTTAQAALDIEDYSVRLLEELETVEKDGLGTAHILPRTPPPRPPRQQKTAGAVGVSPRARFRPMPPVGIAAREDVDIYRYSQAADLRMAIRPLFERRREVEAVEAANRMMALFDEDGQERRPVSPEAAEATNVHSGGEDGLASMHNQESGTDECQQEIRLDDGNAKTDPESDDVAEESRYEELDGESDSSRQPIRFVPAMRLSVENCHEPFLPSEPPMLHKLRAAILDSTPVIKPPAPPPDVPERLPVPPLLHKLVWSGPHTISKRRVIVSITIASDGAICVSCTGETETGTSGDGGSSTITLSDSALMRMKSLRADLVELSPQWIDWVARRLSLRDDNSIQLDLDEQSSAHGTGREHVFSKSISISTTSGNKSEDEGGREVVVDVFLLQTEMALAIEMKDTQSKQISEIVLTKSEVLSVAVSTGVVGSNHGDADLSKLLRDSALLERLCELDVVRLAIATLDAPALDRIDLDHDKCDAAIQNISGTQPTCHELGADSYAANDSNEQDDVRAILRNSSALTSIALLAQAHSEDAELAATRALSQQEAVLMYAKHYSALATSAEASDPSFDGNVRQRVAAAKADKLNRLAFASIVDDLLLDLLRDECRAARHEARHSRELRGHFAAKLQAAFRMSRQRQAYASRQNDRRRAATTIQARQRGITSRCRFRDMQVNRDRLVYFRLVRSSVYSPDDSPSSAVYALEERVAALQAQTERFRHRLLMQVLAGFVLDTSTSSPRVNGRLPSGVIRAVLDKFGPAVGGHRSGLGEAVMQMLQGVAGVGDDPIGPSAVYSVNQVSAALLLALRTPFVEPSPWLATASLDPDRQQNPSSALQLSLQLTSQSRAPRWVLKANAAVRIENRERQSQIRELQHTLGQEAAQYVAQSFHATIDALLPGFEASRRVWEEVASAHERTAKSLDEGADAADQLAQQCLDQLVVAITDSGVDVDALMDGLNLCYRCDLGTQIVASAEEQFNALAAVTNERTGRVSILPLRDEVVQELDAFHQRLATRCLDLARGVDAAELLPASALLHCVLTEPLHDRHVRLALPAVLPIASVGDKYELVRRMVVGYAGFAFGEAVNLVCWSCVNSTEQVDGEAAQLADLLTRLSPESSAVELSAAPRTVASLALERLTGAPFVRFLQFLAWAAHANGALQTRVRLLLSPLAARCELVRFASALGGLESARDAATLYAKRFARGAVAACDAFWVPYRTQFGQEARARALESCARRGEGGRDGLDTDKGTRTSARVASTATVLIQ